MLLNYHVGRLVLSSLCVGDLMVLVLQAEAQLLLQPTKRAPLKTSRTKSPTHNEMRTRRPMW